MERKDGISLFFDPRSDSFVSGFCSAPSPKTYSKSMDVRRAFNGMGDDAGSVRCYFLFGHDTVKPYCSLNREKIFE